MLTVKDLRSFINSMVKMGNLHLDGPIKLECGPVDKVVWTEDNVSFSTAKGGSLVLRFCKDGLIDLFRQLKDILDSDLTEEQRQEALSILEEMDKANSKKGQ